MALAMARSTTSPTWWPYWSLSFLKWSTSIVTIATRSVDRWRLASSRTVLVEVATVRQLGQLVGPGLRLGGLVRVDPGERRRRFRGRAA